MKGKFFVLTGTSGAGKTTILHRLLDADKNLHRIVTYTTRLPRGNEKNGEHYNFVSEEAFKKMMDQDLFLEWATVYENFYGEMREDVEKLLDAGKDVLLLVDPQGAKKITETDIPSTTIFIDATNEDLMKRIEKRGADSEEQIKTRLEAIEFDRSFIKDLDHSVTNEENKLDEAVKNIQQIIEKTRNS